MTSKRVLNDIAEERAYQDQKWGGAQHDEQHPPFSWLVFIQKYLGRASAAAMDPVFTDGRGGLDEYRKQLVKVAALTVAAIETLDRVRGEEPIE